MVKQHLKSLKSARKSNYLIADAALYTKETIQSPHAQKKHYISRVPVTIKQARDAISEVNLDEISPLENGSAACWINSNYADVPQRWLIVSSNQARKREQITFDKNMSKSLSSEQKQLDKFCKNTFACKKDAERALEAFKKTLKISSISDVTYEQLRTYDHAGRPKKGQSPDKHEYKVTATLTKDDDKVAVLQQHLGLFIIATNDCESDLSMQTLLNLYKSQQKVERGFRFLKSPEFLTSSLYLKKPERIEALLMVMTVSLLV